MELKNLVRVLLVVSVAPLWGCSTTMVSMDYEGDPEPANYITSGIGQIQILDDRGTDADWLGAIRGGYGNVLKELRTEKPMRTIVEDVYRTAFVEYGYLDEPDGQVLFSANITKLDCSYYFNREAHAHIDIELVDRTSGTVLFKSEYKTDLEEAGVGAGIFGDIETLRDLAEEALNQTVDKSLSDLNLIAALARAEKPIVDDSIKQLRELRDQLDAGSLSEEEFEEQKRELLDDL